MFFLQRDAKKVFFVARREKNVFRRATRKTFFAYPWGRGCRFWGRHGACEISRRATIRNVFSFGGTRKTFFRVARRETFFSRTPEGKKFSYRRATRKNFPPKIRHPKNHVKSMIFIEKSMVFIEKSYKSMIFIEKSCAINDFQ